VHTNYAHMSSSSNQNTNIWRSLVPTSQIERRMRARAAVGERVRLRGSVGHHARRHIWVRQLRRTSTQDAKSAHASRITCARSTPPHPPSECGRHAHWRWLSTSNNASKAGPVDLYLYLAKKSLWKAAIRATTASISSSGGKKVVRKCHVPSFWPNPDPGTTTIPVSSSNASA